MEWPQSATSFHPRFSSKKSKSRARSSIVISSSPAKVNDESPIPLYWASIKKNLGSSDRAPVVVHQYLETWKYGSSWADWHIGRQSAKDIITGMTLSHSLVYSLVITLQRRHTTDHDNWRCLAQMLRPQNVICKLGSIRQLNNSRSCLRYKSRRWVSREAPTDELNHPFYDKV